jgi:hypothetical protein
MDSARPSIHGGKKEVFPAMNFSGGCSGIEILEAVFLRAVFCR